METRNLLLGHSPDPDDAFMFYALAQDRIPSGRWRFEHILQDIQTLNERALRGELHITAISIHAYPYVADKYALLACGSSMGDGYGPLVVAREPMAIEALRGKRIAVPGEMTTAFLALNLLLGKDAFEYDVVMFDRILDAVADGGFDAGLIIHEGQLTYGNQQLHAVVDLGVWWKEQTGLPLPLGGNVIRRDLGPEAMADIATILRASIQYGLDHRTEAVRHALRYARDMNQTLADRFVGMYVNDWTLDYGEVGRQAVCELLGRARNAGLVPGFAPITFV
ncbi:MAG: ABC transporter substrate-binding protein [Phycisphaerae bacterium]|nr:ABC transporter substrate-binding protein [Phycisphaerae bacterium]